MTMFLFDAWRCLPSPDISPRPASNNCPSPTAIRVRGTGSSIFSPNQNCVAAAGADADRAEPLAFIVPRCRTGDRVDSQGTAYVVPFAVFRVALTCGLSNG